MAKKYDAGVKEYRDTYWTPEYVPLDSDLLACFKCTGQEGVPREEVAAAVAAESSTGTWSTVWSELLTDLLACFKCTGQGRLRCGSSGPCRSRGR